MSAKENAAKIDVGDLNAQIADLQARLEIAEKGRTEAEELNLAIAQADQFSGNTEERPTGKTMKIKVCLNPGEREEKNQKWKEVSYPTYFYTINLPAGAGLELMTNGVPYYHGQTYEFDPMSLADIKSRVARCWDHEKSIHGDNENAYRKPKHARV